jgi:hypothetical protein
MMRNILLTLCVCLSLAPLPTTLLAENSTHALSCEICQKKDSNGSPCKGKVTRGQANSSGVNYSCSNGHSFFVRSKIRVN